LLLQRRMSNDLFELAYSIFVNNDVARRQGNDREDVPAQDHLRASPAQHRTITSGSADRRGGARHATGAVEVGEVEAA